MCSLGSHLSDPIADLDLLETPELSDVAGGDGRAPHDGPVLENADRGHLVLQVAAETKPVAASHRSGEHPDIGDPLAGGAPFDLEHAARDGPISIAHGCWQQLRDAGHQWHHTRSRD